jgi:tellurite resistance protein TerC
MQWALFWVGVGIMLVLDLFVFHKHAHEVRVREAAIWSLVWVGLAMAFNGFVWWARGPVVATEFLSGYLIEKSLSVDNIFVFVLIFSAFRIPAMQQHRVLFWGVLGALVLRAAMVYAGAALLSRFHVLIYIFGGFLVFTGIKLLREYASTEEESQSHWLLDFTRRVIPSTPNLHGEHFFVKHNGKWLATPLFVALVAVELSDVVFAVDSIPAVFAVTSDPFIVLTSNVFAILGLRSLFFIVERLVRELALLKVGLGIVLIFVGVKMAIMDVFKIPPLISLAVIASVLLGSVVASWLLVRKTRAQAKAPSVLGDETPGAPGHGDDRGVLDAPLAGEGEVPRPHRPHTT